MLTEHKTRYSHYFIDEFDVIQGEYIEYHPNGQIEWRGNCVNGNWHGEVKEYYPCGQLREHSFFNYGVRHGLYKEYDNHGGLCDSTFYCDGVDLRVDPDTLTEKDKAYIMMSGRLPPRD